MSKGSTTVNGYGLRTPAGWWECTLKDVCNGNGGVIQTGPFGSQLHAHDYKDTGTPVVMPQQLGDNQISIDGIARISDEDVERLKRHCLRRGDIVFGRRGDVTRRAFITERVKGWLCGTGCMLIRPHHPNLCNEYLAFFFSLHEVKEYITKQAVGATMPNLNTGILEAIPLFLPSLTYQQKAVSILSAYDDLIENNSRRIAILEAMAQAIYREWFVHFRFPGHEKAKRINSPLGQIPEGWKVVKVEDAIFINPKVTVPKDGEKHFVSMGAVPHNTMLIDAAAVEMRTGNSGSKFQNGDTLFARITPCLENGKTAFVQFLESSSDVAFGSTEFIVLRSKTICPEFVYLLARSDPFRDNAIKSMSGATGRQRVQEKCFDKLFFAHPDSKTISEFSAAMQPLFRQVFTLDKKNRNLRRTRDLLLPKLISGQLDVEALDIDAGEPSVEAVK